MSGIGNITAPTGLGETQEGQVHAMWETLDSVVTEAASRGFLPVERPVFAPPVLHPEWLDSMTPETYHLLTAQLSAWDSYAQYNSIVLECGIEECDNEMDQLERSIKKHIRGTVRPKPSEEAIKDEAKTNPRYLYLTQRKQQLSQMKKLIEPHLKRYGRDLRILSRALEIRRQELELGGRGDARGSRLPSFT